MTPIDPQPARRIRNAAVDTFTHAAEQGAQADTALVQRITAAAIDELADHIAEASRSDDYPLPGMGDGYGGAGGDLHEWLYNLARALRNRGLDRGPFDTLTGTYITDNPDYDP